jgi:hypothetical protein
VLNTLAVREDEREAHRNVHGDRAARERLGGIREIRPPAVQHHRRCDQQAHDPQVAANLRIHALRVSDIERHGEHHDLHHAGTGHGEPLEQVAPLSLGERVGALPGDELRAVAQIGDP